MELLRPAAPARTYYMPPKRIDRASCLYERIARAASFTSPSVLLNYRPFWLYWSHGCVVMHLNIPGFSVQTCKPKLHLSIAERAAQMNPETHIPLLQITPLRICNIFAWNTSFYQTFARNSSLTSFLVCWKRLRKMFFSNSVSHWTEAVILKNWEANKVQRSSCSRKPTMNQVK
jgi:hypothetical protein